MNSDSHRPSEDQMRRRFWLLFLRVAAVCEIVGVLFTHARGSTQELERTFYLVATSIFLVGLCWKRIYGNPAFRWQPVPFAFLTIYVGLLIRHSSFSSFFAVGFIVVEALAVIAWLQSRKASGRDSGEDSKPQ